VHCSQVTELLSEYMDEALDPTTRTRVEEHLADCPACAAELVSLRTYLEAIGALPRVQAPVDFLASVHERLEQPGLLKRLLTWIFFPLKVKLPFEAAGLIAASLLVVLLYRGTGPEKAQLAHVSPAPSLQAPTAPTALGPAAPASPAPVPSAASRPSSEESMEVPRPHAAPLLAVEELKKDEAPPILPVHPSPPAQALSVEEPRKDKAPRVSPQEAAKPPVQETLSAKPQARFSGPSPKPVELLLRLNPPADLQAASETVLREQPPAGASPPIAAPQAQDQALSRKAAPDRMRTAGKAEQTAPESPATILSRIKKLLEEARGSVLSVDYEQDSQMPRMVTAQLPARSYPTFLNELRRLGQLEEPAVKPKITNQDALFQLQILLLPPR
jgi:hypothetical protein